MRRFTRRNTAILAVALGVLVLPAQKSFADATLSNLGLTSSFSQIITADPANPNTYVAQSFITGTVAGGQWSLQSIVIGMDQSELSTVPPFALAIYTDNAGTPGSLLTTLSGTNDPAQAGPGDYTYTAEGAVLSISTQYWIVASATATTAFESGYVWQTIDGTGTEFVTQAPGWSVNAAQAIAVSSDNLSWSIYTAEDLGGNLAFTVNAVPEPSNWTMLALGSGLIGFAAIRRKKHSTASSRPWL